MSPRRAFAALALLLLFAPAHAADGWERFFEPSLGDLRAEAAEAKKDGGKGLVVMYHFEECPYCERMKREVLSRPEVQAHYRKAFRALAIDTRGSQEITGFSGKTLPENEFTRAAGVRATPTFQFYAPDGTLLYTQGGAIYDPAEFMLLGDYVASGAHRSAPFTAYKRNRQKQRGS
ncbi:MAG: thioredoxin family protein [Burkholderiales bacterium]|nr:thioredoxin family protein [Burkholderiales bacterium]